MNILFVQRQIKNKKERDIVKKLFYKATTRNISATTPYTSRRTYISAIFFSVFSHTSAWSGSVSVRVRSLTNASVVVLFLSSRESLIPALGEKKQNSRHKVMSLRLRTHMENTLALQQAFCVHTADQSDYISSSMSSLFSRQFTLWFLKG